MSTNRLFQLHRGREREAVSRVFNRQWLGLGGEVEAFEREFEQYFDVKAV